MKKNVGIWIDNTQALIVFVEGGNETVKVIESEVENTHPKGGSGSSTPYGPQDVISEGTVMERKKQQFKRFYAEILDEISLAKELYIMGPAEAKTGLKKAHDDRNNRKPELVAFAAAERMTENQLRAKVRKFFKDKPETKK